MFFIAGIALGRRTAEWQYWKFITQPVIVFGQATLWFYGILGSVLLTALGESIAELILDGYRIEKQYNYRMTTNVC